MSRKKLVVNKKETSLTELKLDINYLSKRGFHQFKFWKTLNQGKQNANRSK